MAININVEKLGKTKLEKFEELQKVLNPQDGQPTKFTWKEEQASKFIDYIKDETGGLLKKIRTEKMSTNTKTISKLVDAGQFLKPKGTYTRDSQGYQFGTDGIELRTSTLEGKIYVSDDELRRNIEGKTLLDHLQAMIGRKVGNELLKIVIEGRKLDNSPDALHFFNGVKYNLQQNGNFIDALTLTSREISKRTLITGKKAVPAKFRQDLELITNSDLKIDIDELFTTPERPDRTVDRVLGMPINENSVMDGENPVRVGVNATITAQVNVGDTNIPVDTDLTNNLQAGDAITVNYGQADEFTYTVASVSSDSITITEGVKYPIAANSIVDKVNLDGSDLIYTNPKNIILGFETNLKAEFERVAPYGYNVWFTLQIDTQVENPQAAAIITNLKAKDY